VKSNRSFLHHALSEGQLDIYVPNDRQKRRACYESQLPKLLAMLMEVDHSAGATFDISGVIRINSAKIDDLLLERDIPSVSWIEKPVFDTSESVGDDSSEDSDSSSTLEFPTRHACTVSRLSFESSAQVQPPPLYGDLIDQVVRSAQRANDQYRRERGLPVDDALAHADNHRYIDHVAAFGHRGLDQFAHDRRIGAAGEAYVRFLSLVLIVI